MRLKDITQLEMDGLTQPEIDAALQNLGETNTAAIEKGWGKGIKSEEINSEEDALLATSMQLWSAFIHGKVKISSMPNIQDSDTWKWELRGG